jgi:Zn-dependent protease with chaperone function
VLAFGAESIVHGLICAAALVVLQRWRRDAPGTRLGCVVVAMVLPALLTPLVRVLAPARLTPAFRDGPALFSASHFLPWAPVGALAVGVLAALGVLLYLRDLVPFVRDLAHGRPGQRTHEGVAVRAVEKAAQRIGVPVPPVMEIEHTGPVLMCCGWRPRVIISAGLAHRLQPDELDAALTHEMAHTARRDPRLGWGLMLVRTLCFWNPAVQLLGRRAVREIERRADQTAARLMGDERPLVNALSKMAEMQARDSWLDRLAHRDIEARCRAVLIPANTSRPSWPLGFALGLAIIVFLVVV